MEFIMSDPMSDPPLPRPELLEMDEPGAPGRLSVGHAEPSSGQQIWYGTLGAQITVSQSNSDKGSPSTCLPSACPPRTKINAQAQAQPRNLE